MVSKKMLLVWSCIALSLIVTALVGLISYDAGYTAGYVDGVLKVDVGQSCSLDSDCKIPMEYLIRSSCPFESKCIGDKCSVVCIGPYGSEQESSDKIPQCSKDFDCDCSIFYDGSDIKRCLCIDGLCSAVVSG